MKGIASAILVGSLFAVTQAALAADPFPPGAEGLSYSSEPPVRSTYQAEHPVSQNAVPFEFPMGAEGMSRQAEPLVHSTYQSEHPAISSAAVGGDFPPGARELRERAEPPVRSTYQSVHARSVTDSAD